MKEIDRLGWYTRVTRLNGRVAQRLELQAYTLVVLGSNPSAPTTLMPFLALGLILLIVGVIFLRKSIREEDREGIIGVMAIIAAAVIMIMFFGLFYTLTIF